MVARLILPGPQGLRKCNRPADDRFMLEISRDTPIPRPNLSCLVFSSVSSIEKSVCTKLGLEIPPFVPSCSLKVVPVLCSRSGLCSGDVCAEGEPLNWLYCGFPIDVFAGTVR